MKQDDLAASDITDMADEGRDAGESGEAERCLSVMTDTGKFERLATAVLREAEPMYKGLSHPGVNAAGKTVASPVDGVCYVPGSDPPLLPLVHHTICAQRELRGKWLGAAPKARGRHKAAPPAHRPDLAKVLDIVRRERERTPNLRARLVLTTNQEPGENLIRDVKAWADHAGIEIDVWSRSRIAHFLDHDPEGQWLRCTQLGLAQKRLSRSLLRALSKASLDTLSLFDTPAAWVDRGLDAEIAKAARGRDVVFVVAASGYGKTTACRKLLERHTDEGGCGLVLPADIVAASPLVDSAVEATLLRLCPTLAPGCGAAARSLCDRERPLFLVVEDVNRFGARELLLERIAGWSAESSPRAGRDTVQREPADWRLMCPVWPEAVALLRDGPRKAVEALSVRGSAFSPAEAAAAVRRRAELADVPLGPLEAETIAARLGNDPFLIALNGAGNAPEPTAVLGDFVASRTRELAAQMRSATASELRSTLRALSVAMLVHRRLDPTWTDIGRWFEGRSEVLVCLRALAHQGEIVRLTDDGREQQSDFRHDRVRDHLLAEAIASLMRDRALQDHVLAEPYYAEVIGHALSDPDVPAEWAARAAAANPLALFFALQSFGEPTAPVHHATLAEIDAWLADPAAHGRHDRSLRRAASFALARTTSPRVVKFMERLGATPWAAAEARLRNGNMAGALHACGLVEPGTTSSWRDVMVAHAKAAFGGRLTSWTDHLLRRPDLGDDARVAALRLAGHIGRDTLADAVAASWSADHGRAGRLREYLWAGARCCGDDPERLLGPVCEAWAVLPMASDGAASSPRDDLAADDVSWAFRDALPEPALRYFIRRAANDDLRWQITYMLRGVDHPDAVEFLAREMAGADRRPPPGNGWFFASRFVDGWDRRRRNRGRVMSEASRSRLRALWRDKTADPNLRTRAFDLWAAAGDHADVGVLQSLLGDGPFADRALVALLRRGERGTVSRLIQRIEIEADDRRSRGYWWQFARDVFGAEFIPALDRELSRRRAEVDPGWGGSYGTDWIIGELLNRLPPDQAGKLLIQHWDHVRYASTFVQAALYTATPHTTELARGTIEDCPHPERLMEHVGTLFNAWYTGHPGVADLRQLKALLPHLHLLDSSAIFTLWDLCNRRGWYDFRRGHLDARLEERWSGKNLLSEGGIVADLDDMATGKRPMWQLHHWAERYLGVGEAKGRLLAIVKGWLAGRRSVEAFGVAAAILTEVGTRSDLDLLSVVAIEPAEAVHAITVDAMYAVRRRTLA